MRSSRPSLRDRRGLVLAALVILTAPLAAACAAAAPSPAAKPVIRDAWVRPPTGPDRPAAGYMTIRNPGGQPETLIGAATDAASSVELHRTTLDSGMAGMHPTPGIHIPAGGTVSLAPGSFHLMLIGPKTMTVGETIELELRFESAGSITVRAEVRNG